MPDRFYREYSRKQQANRAVDRPKVILVEGPDDIYFFDELLRSMGASTDAIQLIDYEGKTNISRYVRLLTREAPFVANEVVTLAIVQDADGDYDRARANLNEAYTQLGVSEKSSADLQQVSTGFRLASFILPDNRSSGDLDSLLMSTVAQQHSAKYAWSYLDQCGIGINPGHAKRAAQVYLAAQRELCRGAGKGASLGYFDLQSQQVDPLRAFLKTIIDS